MSSIETLLKKLILQKFKSFRVFARKANIPASTLATVLERGIRCASISTVFKICNTLSIDIDSLMLDEICYKPCGRLERLKPNTVVAVLESGKEQVYELTSDQIKLLTEMAEALTTKS